MDTTYDPHTPDSYAEHLAHLNPGGGTVATRDIHNADGALLVRKGFAIKPDTVKRLLNHKLVQPLETSVRIDNAPDADKLFDDLQQLLQSDMECWAIHLALELDQPLRDQCRRYASFPLIAQKTTVLAARLPGEYRKALFCAWFSYALATRLHWKGSELDQAFLAGLVHDVGLLHIDPAIVEKSGQYTTEEWRALQSHSLIADTFLSYVEHLPDMVRRAVREHHERCDGTGYPAALFGENLCTLGQIVAMADVVWAISKKPEGRKAQSLAEVLLIAKMDAAQHSDVIQGALYHLYQGGGLASHPVIQPHHGENNSGCLLKQANQLRQQFGAAEQLRALLPAEAKDRLMRSVRIKLERLWFIVHGSGLLSEPLGQWLRRLEIKTEEAADYELHEVSLMYNELQWQLAQTARTLQLIINRSGDNANLRKDILAALEGLAPESTADVTEGLAATTGSA